METITKAELSILEKMFVSEIEHALSRTDLPYCYQSKSKLLLALEQKGLVEAVKITLGGRFAMEIKGWASNSFGTIHVLRELLASTYQQTKGTTTVS